MIDDLDTVLLRLFRDRIPALANDSHVRFEPPNDDWRNYVSNLGANNVPTLALNVYLADLRENRQLRSPERLRGNGNGYLVDEPAPTRIDCHYLLSAWDAAAHTPQVQPTPSEHALLYDVLAVLLDNVPLNPSRIMTAGLGAIDVLIRDSDLPAEVAPPEGFPKLAEFWGGMGQGSPWKPAIYLIVTIPVRLSQRVVGPIVTTAIGEYELEAGGAREVWIQIGGSVLDAGDNPLPDAWVRLETLSGVAVQTTRTNGLGRFTFVGLDADRYLLRYRATGFAERRREINVPETSGEYDLRFS